MDRNQFLDRVRQSLRQSSRPGEAAPLPDRGNISYQGGGPDLVATFREQLVAAGGTCHVVADAAAAIAKVLALAQAKSAKKALLGHGPFVDSLALTAPLRTAGLDVLGPDGLTPQTARDPFFAADVGITGVDYLIAETGSVVLLAKPGEPRSFSLLPPVHIAVAERRQILPDLFDLFAGRKEMPSGLVLITGPSKTGDIELKLVTGVHGPGEIHVVVVDG